MEATDILMELLEKTGLKTFVGKVNMDRNGPGHTAGKKALKSPQPTQSAGLIPAQENIRM